MTRTPTKTKIPKRIDRSELRARLSDVATRIAALDAHIETLYDERAYWWAVLLVAGEMRADVAYMSGKLNKETVAWSLRVRLARLDKQRLVDMKGRPLPELCAVYLELLGRERFVSDLEEARCTIEKLADVITEAEQSRPSLVEERDGLFLRGLADELSGVELAKLAGVTSMVVSNVKKARASV